MGGHYTKQEVENRAFLFVSYKHDNVEQVGRVVDQLYEKGVCLWYDADLHPGDRWTEIARGLIRHPNCRGVIFFNSAAAFKSEAVHRERCWTAERIEQGKQTGEPFYIFSVNINGDSVMHLLKQVFDSLPDSPAAAAREFSYEHLASVVELFDDNVIFTNTQNIDRCVEDLYGAIDYRVSSVIDVDYLRMKKLEQSTQESTAVITVGVCQGEPAALGVPPHILQTDQVASVGSSRYIVWDGQAYYAKPLTWIPLYCEKDIFVLLARDLVGKRPGGPELQSWLEGAFKRVSFSEQEASAIRGIRLLTAEDMRKTVNSGVFSFEESQSHWWIGEKNVGALQRVIRKDGTVYTTGYNQRTTRSGVRPVILVHKDDLANITK